MGWGPVELGLALSAVFFCGIFSSLRYRLFAGRYGRRHRLIGLVYLIWLIIGFLDVPLAFAPRLPYDVALGLLGIALTFSAAEDFKGAHAKVKNIASGALDREATVSHSEMVEHGFYQILNLCMVLFLHAVRPSTPLPARLALCTAAFAPWLCRGSFPVNSFSANWRRGQPLGIVSLLYRLKKYQYIFWKHFLFFGAMASHALRPTALDPSADTGGHFRLYWLCLNTAYTCEFFLQTLVKRRYMQQRSMLVLNQLLMLASTIAAVGVLGGVSAPLALFSLSLNFARRGRDFSNAALVLAAGAISEGLGHGRLLLL